MHKTATALAAAMIVFAGGAMYHARVDADHLAAKTQAKVAAIHAAYEKSQLAEDQKYQAWVAGLVKQCSDDHATYKAMTPLEKVKAVAPTCEVSLSK